jgi:hypothetical protein
LIKKDKMSVKTALIACAIIGAIFGVLLMLAGAGSVESAIGHVFKEALHGTVVEQSAASVESAGNDLTSWAHGALTFVIGVLVIFGLMYVGSKSKT